MYTEDTVHYYSLTFSTICVRDGAMVTEHDLRHPGIVLCLREQQSLPKANPSRILAVSNPIRLVHTTEGVYTGIMEPPLTYCQTSSFDLPFQMDKAGSGRGATQVDLAVYLLPNVTGAVSADAHSNEIESTSACISNIPGVSHESLTLTKLIEGGLLKAIGSCTMELSQFLSAQSNVDHDIRLYGADVSDSTRPCCVVRATVDVFANGSGIGFQIRSRQARDVEVGTVVPEFEAIDDHHSTLPVVSCSVSYQPTKGSTEEIITASEADMLHPIPAAFVPKVIFNAADRWATNTLPTSLRKVLYDPFVPLTDDADSTTRGHHHHQAVMQTSALQPPAPFKSHHQQSTPRSQGVVPPFTRTTPFFPLVIGSSQAVFRDFSQQKLTAAVMGGPLAAYELRHPMDDVTTMRVIKSPWWQRNYAAVSQLNSVPSGPRVPVASVSVTFGDIHRWVMLPSGSTTCEAGVGAVTVLDVTSTIAPSTGLPAREIRIDMRASPDPPQPQQTYDHSGAVHHPPPPPGPSELYDGVFTLVLHVHNMQDWLCLMGGRPLPQIGSNNGLRPQQDVTPHKRRLTSPGSAEVEHVSWSMVLRGKRGRHHAKDRSRALEALHSTARRRPFCSWTQRMEGRGLLAGDSTGMLLKALTYNQTANTSTWSGMVGRPPSYIGQLGQTLCRWSGSSPSQGDNVVESLSGVNPPQSTVRSAAALRAHFEHLMSQPSDRSTSPSHQPLSPASALPSQYQRPPSSNSPHVSTVTSSPSRGIHTPRVPWSSTNDPVSQLGAGRRLDSTYRYYVLGTDMAGRDNEALWEGPSRTTGSDLLNRRSLHHNVPYTTPEHLSMQPHLPSTLWGSTSQGTSSYWKSPQRHRDEQHTVLSPPRPPYMTEATPSHHQSMLVRDLPHPEDAYRSDLTRQMYTPRGAHAAAVERIRLAQLVEQDVLAETQLHRRMMSHIFSQPTNTTVTAHPHGLHPFQWDDPRSLLANSSPGRYRQGGAFYPMVTPKAVSGALPDGHIPLNPSDVLYVLCLQGGASLGAVAPYYYSCLYETDYRVADTPLPIRHDQMHTPRFAEATTAGSLVPSLVSCRHDEVLPGRGGFTAGGCDRHQSGMVLGRPSSPVSKCVAFLRNNSFLYWHIVSVEVDALVGALCGMDPVPSYSHYHTQWTPHHVIFRWIVLLLWVTWCILLPPRWVAWMASLLSMIAVVGYGILVVVVGPRKMAPPRTASAIPGMHRNNPRAMSQGFSAWEWLVLRPIGLLPDAPTQSPQRTRTPGGGLRSPSPTSTPSPYSHYVTGASRTMGGADDGCGGNSAAVPDGGLGVVATVGSAVQGTWKALHSTAATISGPVATWVDGLNAKMPIVSSNQQHASSSDDDDDERLWSGHALLRRFKGEDDALHATLHGGSSRPQLDSYRYSPQEKIARYDLCETSQLVSLHTRLAAWRIHAVGDTTTGTVPPSHTAALLPNSRAPFGFPIPHHVSHIDHQKTLRLGEFMLSPVLRHIVTSAFKEGGRTHAAAGTATLSTTLHLRWSRFFSYGQCAPLWMAIMATMLTVVILLRVYYFWFIPIVVWFGPLVGRVSDTVVYTLFTAYLMYPNTLPARWGRALLGVFLHSDTLSS